MKKIIITAGFITLTGCGDSADMTLVKDMVTYTDRTITVGNAFDHREMCRQTTWSEEKDKRNRNIVRYSCEINPADANTILAGNINYVRDKSLEYAEKSGQAFPEQSKEIQLSIFYLQNAEKALKELSSTSLPADYAALKTDLEDYLEQNYQSEHVKHFNFSDKFNIKGKPLLTINQLDTDKYPVLYGYYRIENIENDPVVIRKTEEIYELQQQVIHLFAGNNSALDNLSSENTECGNSATGMYGKITFPCSFKYHVKQAFEAIMFQQQPYTAVQDNIQNTLTEYDEIRDNLDKKLAAYENLKKDMNVTFSALVNEFSIKNFEQVVDFSVIQGQSPEVAGCRFRMTFVNGTIAEIENENCFGMAYQTTFDQSYTNLIRHFYTTDIKQKMGFQIREFIDKEKKIH
ncbi:hypothetical protein VP018_000357 [Morganella morganii]|nr:hypothetical protein [Morganella morganii]EMD0828607.1 hypothetical protein [Morganella morganii]